MDDGKISKKFDRQANLYERQRERQALSTWRRKLIRHAHGNVLELAVGAGANFSYYKRDVHVTAVDISPKMIEKAKEGASLAQVPATFIVSNMETAQFPDKEFDTIVSTLSFCGYEDPLRMLKQITRWCKPGGTVLLLEHGISSNRLIAPIQKVIDPLAKRMIGCHQNRRIIELLDQSALQVVHHETHVQGMFHIIRAIPTS